MFTTAIEQPKRAHQLTWLPLHNKKKERAHKRKRRKQKKERAEKEVEDTNWHQLGTVEGVNAHHPEGLRKQLLGSGSRRDQTRKGSLPTLLLGSDASTMSEDPNAAVTGAWLAIGVFATAELNSKVMEKWRTRIKWKDREAYGGKKCAGLRKLTEQ
jgi:hypothetical protein